jgi:Zn ribbon nucleic-acid-binding protein
MSFGLHPVWRDYRNRRRLLLALAAVVPLFAALGAAPASASSSAAAFAQVLLSVWATGFVAAIFWFAGFRCPFCSQHFHWTWIVANPFSGECLHCGFKKWRDPHAARAYGCR